MKRLFGTFTILVILLIAVTIAIYIYFLIGKAAVDEYNKFDENTEVLKELVGEEVILKGDTLLVIDYSSFNDNVTLEDGRKISGELAKKLEKVEDEE